MYFGSLNQYNVFNKKNNVFGTWANDCWIEPYAVSAVCQPLNGGWVNNKKLGNIVFTRFQIFTLTMAIEWNIEKCITILFSIKYYPLALFLIGFTILNEKIMQIYSFHANPVMLSSTLLIASAYTSDVISRESWKYLSLFHDSFGHWVYQQCVYLFYRKQRRTKYF